MRQWYIQFSDNLFGPWSSSEVRRHIKSSKIPSSSYVSLEGEPHWVPVLDLPDFYHSFAGEQLAMKVEELPERHWIVLKSSYANSESFDQDGPYSTREILSQIATGELEYSDRIWKPGFSLWERIGDLDHFIPSSVWRDKTSIEPTPLLNSVDSRDLLSSVARFEGTENCFIEDSPIEAMGPDLVAESTLKLDPMRTVKKTESDAVKQMSFPFKRALTEESSIETRSKHLPKNLVVKGFVEGLKENFLKAFGVVMFLVVLGFIMKHFVSIEASSQLEAKEKIVSRLEKPSLRIVPSGLESLRPRLEFRSNFDRKDQLHIEIIGRDDKILGHYRFVRSVSLPFETGEMLTLNLVDESLPDGLFVVRARLGHLVAEKEIFVGVNDIQFESKLKQFNSQKKKRKDLEEKILASVRIDLEERSKEIRNAMENRKLSEVEWKGFVNAWQRKFYQSAHTEIRNFTNETRANFVLANEFEKLKRARLDLWKLSKDVNFQNKQSRDLFSSLVGIEKELQSL